jgi:hypothetical protein
VLKRRAHPAEAAEVPAGVPIQDDEDAPSVAELTAYTTRALRAMQQEIDELRLSFSGELAATRGQVERLELRLRAAGLAPERGKGRPEPARTAKLAAKFAARRGKAVDREPAAEDSPPAAPKPSKPAPKPTPKPASKPASRARGERAAKPAGKSRSSGPSRRSTKSGDKRSSRAKRSR